MNGSDLKVIDILPAHSQFVPFTTLCSGTSDNGHSESGQTLESRQINNWFSCTTNLLPTSETQPPLYSEYWTTLQNSLQSQTKIETAGEIIVKFQQFVAQWDLESPLVFCSVNYVPSWIDSGCVCIKSLIQPPASHISQSIQPWRLRGVAYYSTSKIGTTSQQRTRSLPSICVRYSEAPDSMHHMTFDTKPSHFYTCNTNSKKVGPGAWG